MTDSLFQSPSFLSTANIYEVNIRQYSPEGSFNAFAAQLPRLKDMGVDILWLMPVHPIGLTNRKGSLGSYYAINDHKAVNPEFGTPQDLKDLVMKAHALGMKVILDWVANHVAWDHVWTKTNPDFLVHDESGNFKSPYDWNDVIQIDHSNKKEQEAMIGTMQYWVTDFDIDGFRADLAHLTPLQFWKDARLKISALKKDMVWLAETEEPSFHEAFDISFTWVWMHATEKLVKKEITLKDCLPVLEKYKTDFPAHAKRLFFTSNHDENSWNGTEYEKYGVFVQALAVFSFTYPGAVPLIYSGQELPNLKRLKFFDKDLISWDREPALQDFYSRIAAFRKTSPVISGSEPTFVLFEEAVEKNVLAYKLAKAGKEIFVLLNFGTGAVSLTIELGGPGTALRDIFSDEQMVSGSEFHFSAEPGGFRVLER